MKALALISFVVIAVSGCRKTSVAEKVSVTCETTPSADEPRVSVSGDLPEELVSDLRCAKVFSFMGYSGAGAKRVAGSVATEWLLTLCKTRERRIHELYVRYYGASIEGKAYILWGLYALDAEQYPECRRNFSEHRALQINVVDGCFTSKLSCYDFIARLESVSKDKRLKEITSIFPTEELGDEKSVVRDSEQAGADQPATKSADKPPVKDQPSPPTPNDRPR